MMPRWRGTVLLRNYCYSDKLRSSFRKNSTSFRALSSWQVDPWTGVVEPDTKGGNDDRPTYQTIIGLEIHAQLQIPDKLFSPASSSGQYGRNSSIHPFDVAVPGKLPYLSLAAVQKAVLASAILNCQINPVSRFERKHYTYADLPPSYQITQQRWPLAVDGMIEFPQMTPNGNKISAASNNMISCRIERIQLEQDTGKTTSTTRGKVVEVNGKATTVHTTFSRVDFSRAGCALVEIVTAPDLRSGWQAASMVQTIRQLFRFTNLCGGRMEEGQLRVDCNVNLQQPDGRRTPRVEVKNLNSIQQLRDAVDFEAHRQAQDFDGLVSTGVEETRTWDVATQRTIVIRTKDQAPDYRFMPEPDLPPLVLNESILDGLSLQKFVSQSMPELPAAAKERLQASFSLNEEQAAIISRDQAAIRIFEDAMATVSDVDPTRTAAAPKLAANLLCNELLALVKEAAEEKHHYQEGGNNDDDDFDANFMADSKVSGQQLGDIVVLLLEEKISNLMAKKLLTLLYTEEHYQSKPRSLAQEKGFELITDQETLRDICRAVVNEMPKELDVYRRGGKFVIKMQKLFTGKCMGRTKGNAHPERLRDALHDVLEELAPGVQ